MALVPPGHYPPAMNFPLQRLALPLLAAAVLTLLSAGCNTAKGVGKDVEKLGDKIQDKSGK
jgi:predicted small secreted protein